MKKKIFILCCLTTILITVFFPLPSGAGELTIEPSLQLRGEYDDNLDFDPRDETGDWGAYAIPAMTLNYATELLEVSLLGELDFLKYLDETSFDRTNALFGFDGSYRMAPRWILKGDFQFRRDETIDSQLEETGQAFERNRVNRDEKRECKLYAASKSAELEGMNIEKMTGSLLKTDINSIAYFNVEFRF